MLNPEEEKRLALDWIEFRESEHFDTVMGFLRDQGAAGQSVFAAAGWNPYQAAALDARQNVVRLVEGQIARARKILQQGQHGY